MSYQPMEKLISLERDIDALIKKRIILFEYRDEEPFRSFKYRLFTSDITQNTKRLEELRKRWKDVRDYKKEL